MSNDKLPQVPRNIIQLIQAYGDARADLQAGAKVDTASPLEECVRAIRQSLAAEAEKQAGPVASQAAAPAHGERAVFEAWYEGKPAQHMAACWNAWVARAALAASESDKEDASACISAKPDAQRPHRPDDFCPDQRCGLIGQCARAKEQP